MRGLEKISLSSGFTEVCAWYMLKPPNMAPTMPPIIGPCKTPAIMAGMCMIVMEMGGIWMKPIGVGAEDNGHCPQNSCKSDLAVWKAPYYARSKYLRSGSSPKDAVRFVLLLAHVLT